MLTPLLTVSREAITDGSTAVSVDHAHLNMSLNVGRVQGTGSITTQVAQQRMMPPLVSGGSVSSLTMMNTKKRLQKFGMRQQMHMTMQRDDNHTNTVLRSNDDEDGTLPVRNRMTGSGRSSVLQQDFGEMTIAGQSTRLHAGQTFRGTLTR